MKGELKVVHWDDATDTLNCNSIDRIKPETEWNQC